MRNGPIAGLSLGADLGLETYGETVDTSVAIGLVTCRGVGNRPHVIPGLTLFQATVVHEIGHTVAFADQRRLQTAFEHVFWPGDDRARGQGRPVSTYALLSASEDFAESFLHYRYNADWMARSSPERYAWMRPYVFGGREFRARARAG